MKRQFFSALTFAAALAVWSVPSNRRPFLFRQPDGTVISVTLIGDEYEHYYLTAAGDKLTETLRNGEWWLEPIGSQDDLDDLEDLDGLDDLGPLGAGPQRATAIGHYPTLGSPHQLVLLVEYPDCRFRYDGDLFRRMLCEEGYSVDGATGSAFDYFHDQSRGLFTPEFEVVGPIMLPHPRAYYGTPTANMYDAQPWLMVTDAAPQVDDVVDFSRFDNDGDGFVDNVFVFYAGEGQNDGGPLEAVWPHAANIWTYYGLECTLDGVQLGSYACTNEVTGAGRMTGIGTFCHEYSHVLGLPDLYSTQDASACFSPGAYELMDSGSYNNEGRTPPNMSAYDRMALGWMEPDDLTAPETVVLAPLPSGSSDGAGGYSTVRRITTVKPEEYYLLENRQREGWDAFLPGHGMLIWHIDYDARAWADNQVNVRPDHQRVDLVEADGVLTKDTQDGDPFPGARQMTSVNLTPWTGVPLDAGITEIREAPLQLPPLGGGLDGAEGSDYEGSNYEGSGASAPGTVAVTFKFRGGGERIDAPVALEAEDVGPCGFTACWTGVPAVTDYKVVVWRGDEPVALDNVSVALPHADSSTGRWTTTVGGLAPSTRYRYAVVAVDGERRSPLSNEVRLTTLPPTFDMLSPTDLAAVPTAEGWTLTWTPLAEAAAYEVETFALQLVAPEVVTLDFAGGLAALPAGWTTTSTQTSGVAGTFGAGRPSLMLQSGEWLQSPVFGEAIGDYNFWCKGSLTPTLHASDRQLRLTNTGETVAYVDDVVVHYGGRAEQTDVAVYSTADKATAGAASDPAAAGAASDPAATQLVVPMRDGALWCRVRGVAADGRRSAWSAEVAMPLLEGIGAVPADGREHKAASYALPPFVISVADGRKSIKLGK